MKIIIALISALLMLIVVTFLWNSSDENIELEEKPYERVDITNNNQLVSTTFDDKLIVYTLEGNPVRINDFTRFDGVRIVGEGFYHLQGLPGDKDAPVGIMFNSNNDSFSIAIEAEPVNNNHKVVSDAFRLMMGASDEELCELNVLVGVSHDLNPVLSGKNLGLSFCNPNTSLQ